MPSRKRTLTRLPTKKALKSNHTFVCKTCNHAAGGPHHMHKHYLEFPDHNPKRNQRSAQPGYPRTPNKTRATINFCPNCGHNLRGHQ